MEKWERWHPLGADNIGASLGTLAEVSAAGGTLFVEIEFESQVLRLRFPKVLAYRSYLEECVPEVWAKLHSPRPVVWSFWMVQGSNPTLTPLTDMIGWTPRRARLSAMRGFWPCN